MPRLLTLGLVFLLAVFGLSGCSSSSEDEGEPLPVGDFSLTERSGRTVQRSDLLGKVWVASFLFTRCGGACPQISNTLARLQNELADQKDVLLVSFSVDPEHDCCDVLQRYAAGFQADPERWLFLTGKQEEVYRLLQESFRVGVAQNEGEERKPGNEVAHSNRLVVVDRRGNIRGYFDGAPAGVQEEDTQRYERGLKELKKKVAALVREKP